MMVATSTATVNVEVEFGGVVRPGDTLLVRYNRDTSAERADMVKKQLQERLPGVRVLVVQADGLAVYRPDAVSGDDEHAG